MHRIRFHWSLYVSHFKVSIDLEDAYRGATRSLNLRSSQQERSLNVKIPKGVKQGQHIRLQGQGNPGINGGAAGDLYLEIAFNPHPLYRVEELDVYLELPLAPWEAALGGSIMPFKVSSCPSAGGATLRLKYAILSGHSSSRASAFSARVDAWCICAVAPFRPATAAMPPAPG